MSRDLQTGLIRKLQDLESQRDQVERDIRMIEGTLNLLGIEPPKRTGRGEVNERHYADEQPFYKMPLKDACLKILNDAPGDWFSKSQVEYMLARGGYESDAKDPSNSVDVTLRNLAEAGLCEAIRQRGNVGNRYSVSGYCPVSVWVGGER
jgi:hypothetical protein